MLEVLNVKPSEKVLNRYRPVELKRFIKGKGAMH